MTSKWGYIKKPRETIKGIKWIGNSGYSMDTMLHEAVPGSIRPVYIRGELCWIWDWNRMEGVRYINQFKYPDLLQQEILAAEIRAEKKGNK